jgi:protein O-GlcNAc transferase
MAPSSDDIFKQAIVSFQAGKLNDAELNFKKVLQRQPTHVAALNLLSVLLTRLERYTEAEPYIKSALKLNSTSDATFYNYGIILKSLKRPIEALEAFSQALAINAAVPDTWNNRGTVFNDLKRYDDAIQDFDKAISLQPNYSEAFCNKGKSLGELKFYKDAFSAYDRALALKPDFAEAWLGRGNVFCELKRYDEAFVAYDRALALKPDLAEAWNGRGNVFYELKRYDEAFAAHDRALALKPDLAEVWNGRGNVYCELKRYDEAFAAYDRALALKPDLAEAWLGRGNVFYELKRYDKAFAAYDRALALKPDLTGVEGARLNSKMLLCDWSEFDAECAHLLSSVRNGNVNTQPFPLLAITSSSADQLECARLWIANRHPPSDKPIWQGERYQHDRIRVAYLSADFRQHPVSSLMAGMFECHDKSRFDVTAISFGPDDNSEMRQRLKASFEHFTDAKTYGDNQIANLVKEAEIDILVDLMGFTVDSRTSIFARRSAPIQVNYLGYLGTMGAEYIDYIIADRIVIPENQYDFYSEKIVYLPNSFSPADRERRISDKTFTRAEVGLPREGFVFCCFNTNYKITPDVYDIWMRILKQVGGSVLWLAAESPTNERNLRNEATARGVNAERLIFAPRLPLPEHQARLRLADLFLDTLPYNAGATASDTLWAGLPVLTRIGDTFVGRMAASVLNAIGLPELITTTPKAYEALAIDLSANQEKLETIKQKLAVNRLTTPLFDTKIFTKHIETAYTKMYERHQTSLAPDHIVISN